MKVIVLALFLFSPGLAGLAFAQAVPNAGPLPDPRIVQLETALNRVQQEQQSVYQQFLMTQELRRMEVKEGYPLIPEGPSGMGGVRAPPINYDELVRLQRERQERIEQYTRDLNSLYTRYSELGERKRVLMDQLMELIK